MTSKITTTKRDREKLKGQKRKEKQRRKEERQSAGKSSFEDMIAYVDEKGRLRDTPPMEKIDVNIEEIEISTPKQEDVENVIMTGEVEYFNASKGFGFIKKSEGGDKYFFHISSAPANIREGCKVTFDIEQSTRGLNAVHILIINN